MIEGKINNMNFQKVYYGMVGGGEGSFIGDVHRKAAAFDRKCIIAAGCFSRDYNNSLRTAYSLDISQDRVYRNYIEMAEKESKRNDKIDFVTIVTPNNSHFEIAKTFLNYGINVVCDKPLVTDLNKAYELKKIVNEKDLLFCVTYSYSKYSMVKEAKEIIKRGDIGEIKLVLAEYLQDWLAEPIEKEGQKQASWRTDPNQSGISNCVGDIGTHIEHTVSYITGLKIKSLCANLENIGDNRKLDTNAEILIKFDNGASGVYTVSQVAIGYQNGLKIRVFGTKGSIEWEQENPECLIVSILNEPKKILKKGLNYLSNASLELSRVPSGHPEGYYEAFANMYSVFADAILYKKSGKRIKTFDFPNIDDGISGVKFIEKCVESSNSGSVWVDF